MSLSSQAKSAHRALERRKQLQKKSFQKAKRGDVVLVELRHSSTGLIGGKVQSSSYTDFQLAKVVTAYRDGVIRSVRFENGCEKHFDEIERTYALGEHGKVCYEEFSGVAYKSAEEAKKAFLGRIAQ